MVAIGCDARKGSERFRMTALGQMQTCAAQKPMSALDQKRTFENADIAYLIRAKDKPRQARCAARRDELQSNPHILAPYVRHSSGLNALSPRASPRDHYRTKYSWCRCGR